MSLLDKEFPDELSDEVQALLEVAKAVRAIAHGETMPGGLEALAMAINGQSPDSGEGLSGAIERGFSEVAEAIREGLSTVADALRAEDD